ncbi:DHS-like NAD/FAD-binding domain-containing protein [Fomitopsis serialis]|uniref:DHS-like NAD/FAD-binding domain-containing protein n=1 Tax=Fomitopsis serialis TaxID=139415 RepID=UPI0020088F98|nr:DHS-like NAD/FAD-binding domain-containing protein [Neoantrodia serialis]KAH9930335.1 DHS-like NAD/FAD-binding domain-containing protein [Neoantrodia serialis]
MRVSVPNIPEAILRSANAAQTRAILPAEAVERIATFLSPGNAAVVTGAGVSVDSGIRAYRGAKGRYLNPNYKYYHELMDPSPKGAAFRRRYWYVHPLLLWSLRSYLGYPPVRDAQPNTTHFALAALQYTSVVNKVITQNVDGLHHKAIAHVWDTTRMDQRILELHGRLRSVRCAHGHITDRNIFQQQLSVANPEWKAFADELEATGRQPRTNPDGDVVLEGVNYDEFVVPDCPECLLEHRHNNIQKPEVIFFGESITKESGIARKHLFHDVERCDRLLLMGTTLATFSAFRLLRHAMDLHKPVLLLNLGPTRADGLAGVDKIDIASGAVMRDVVKSVLGAGWTTDSVVADLLQSGIVKPPPDDHDDTAPRVEA